MFLPLPLLKNKDIFQFQQLHLSQLKHILNYSISVTLECYKNVRMWGKHSPPDEQISSWYTLWVLSTWEYHIFCISVTEVAYALIVETSVSSRFLKIQAGRCIPFAWTSKTKSTKQPDLFLLSSMPTNIPPLYLKLRNLARGVWIWESIVEKQWIFYFGYCK